MKALQQLTLNLISLLIIGLAVFIDKEGNIIKQPIYLSSRMFHDGLNCVSISGDKYG